MRRNTFRCFVCGAHGGPIDLVMRSENKPFLEACRWLADENNVILTSESSRFQDSCSKCESKPFDASRYERFFLRPWLSDEARRFLFQDRRLDPRVVRWCRLTSFRDKPGERLFLQLKELLPNLEHHQLPPDCKDFSDYYLTMRDKPPDFPS